MHVYELEQDKWNQNLYHFLKQLKSVSAIRIVHSDNAGGSNEVETTANYGLCLAFSFGLSIVQLCLSYINIVGLLDSDSGFVSMKFE